MSAAGHIWALARRTGYAYADNHEPSMWLRGRLMSILTRLETGEQRRCVHLSGNVVGTVALWQDGVVVCPSCTPVLLRDGDPDRTCDRCGHVVPEGGTIHVMALAAAPLLLVTLGLCGDCHRREAAK